MGPATRHGCTRLSKTPLTTGNTESILNPQLRDGGLP